MLKKSQECLRVEVAWREMTEAGALKLHKCRPLLA